jgi:hypothetical protein
MMSETPGPSEESYFDADPDDVVALDIDEDDDVSEQDGLISEETETYPANTTSTSQSSSYPNDDYPYDPHHDDLHCIPELPCSSSYTKVGKLYKCKTDHGLCGGNTLYVGACWPMMLLTQALIWGITLMVLCVYGGYVHWIFVVVGAINMFITAYALCKTSCSDPGIVQRLEVAPDATWRWSERGKTYYPPGRGIAYCHESQVMVNDYDHFCPWTGTTIAGGNMKWFTIFVSSLSILCIVVIFITVIGSASLAVHLQGSGEP